VIHLLVAHPQGHHQLWGDLIAQVQPDIQLCRQPGLSTTSGSGQRRRAAGAARGDLFPITPNDYPPHDGSSTVRSCVRGWVGGRWDESFPGTPSYREVTPPLPVVINLDQALARDNPSLRTTTPLRVSAGGLRLTGYCPGRLHAWVRLTTGTWDGGVHVHRAQRQPPGSTGAAAVVARQCHHPATALIEVDDDA